MNRNLPFLIAACIPIGTTAQLTVDVNQWFFCGTQEHFISAEISGGSPPYQYFWSTGLGSYFSGMTPWYADLPPVQYGDDFYLLVRDQDLHYVVQVVSVGIPYTVVQTTCTGATGEIHLDVSGLTGPLSITWFGPDGFYLPNGTPSLVGLQYGDYMAEVTDANSCTQYKSIRVDPSEDLNVTIDAIWPSGFANGFNPPPGQECAGGVDVTITGGTSPYEVLWQPSQQTTEDLTGVHSTFYHLTVNDAAGCTLYEPGILVPLDWVLTLTAAITSTPSCGAGGAIDLTVTGGTPPYTFLWGQGQTTEDVTNLYAGTHLVTVVDAHGCTRVGQFHVDGTPKSVNFTADITGSCNGVAQGAIDITMTGGVPPFQYTWGGTGGFSASTQDVSALVPGTYWVLVDDMIGCSAVETYDVPSEDPFTLSVVLSPSCNSTGSIDLTVTGGTAPFYYA